METAYSDYDTHNISSCTDSVEINVPILNFFNSFLSQIKKSSEKFDMIHKKYSELKLNV